jgi:predicted PurR-regulated permease PerM
VLIALIFGLAMGVGLRLVGVPYAVSLGTTAGVLEIFPYVGGAITVVLAALTALSVGIPQVVAVLVLYLILVNLESHVLAPLLFGKAIGLPPVAILVALLAGVELLGILGALLAIPIAVILWVIVDEVWPAPNAPAPAHEADAAARSPHPASAEPA